MTTVEAPQAAAAAEPATAGQVAGRRWRRSRGVLFAVLALAVVGVLLALLSPATRSDYLDPASAGRQGTRALVAVTRAHGTPVTVVRSASAAAGRMRVNPDAVLVVARSDRLVPNDLATLRGLPGDRLLVEPTTDTLTALAPGVTAAGTSWATPEPGCALPAATAAGPVAFTGSTLYTAPAGATSCYLSLGKPALVRLPSGQGSTTVLGSGAPLTNERLTDAGDAALGMNLLSTRSGVIWLMPDLPPAGSGTQKSFTDLVPFGVKLAVLQIMIAVVLVALWRARRLGPVVAEALPVVVRSAEAVEGRARLYHARRAADRAAQALRAGALERLVRRLGMPASAAADPAMAAEIVAALAAHTGRDQALIGSTLYGPPPADDAGLVRLAGFLDELERQVRDR